MLKTKKNKNLINYSLKNISISHKDVVGEHNRSNLKIKYNKFQSIWYEKNFLCKNNNLKLNYYQSTNFLSFISINTKPYKYFLNKTFIHYEFMEFYHYLNDYYFLNIFEVNKNKIFTNFSIEKISNIYLQTLLLPLTTFFNVNNDFSEKKKNIFFLFDFTTESIFDSLDISKLGTFLDKEDKLKILNYFCHFLSDNLPFFWFFDKNNYLKDVCFFSTGTYFNSVGNSKVTILDKKKFFGSFLRNETLDLVIDKYWFKPLILFLRKNLYYNKNYKNNTNIINYVYLLLYKSYFNEFKKISFINKGIYNLFFSLFKNKNFIIKSKNYNLNKIFKPLLNFVNLHSFLFIKKNIKQNNFFFFNFFFFNFIFKEYHKLFFIYALKKHSFNCLPSTLSTLKKSKLLSDSSNSNFLKNFFLQETTDYGHNPIIFNINKKSSIVNKTLIDIESFDEKNSLLTTFQHYNLKGLEVNRSKLFFKNYLVSNSSESLLKNFESLFNFLKIKFFTSHFSHHLPKKKIGTFDSIISFYKWKIFLKKKMPYFFDGPWMSAPKNKIGRYWIAYIVNNISDYWFLKNKTYLNNLHFSLLGYKFSTKKKITVKKLRKFYAAYIYTLCKYKLQNNKIYNPYVILLNKFYLSPIVPFYLVNTEDNFGRFFEEYYFGYNKQFFYTLTSLVRQEFAIANSFLLKNLRMYTDTLKYQNKNFFSDDEDIVWDLNLSGHNSLYSGRSATNGLHIFVNFLYEDFFRSLVNVSNDYVPVQEKCKSDSLFFHTFTWDTIEPLD